MLFLTPALMPPEILRAPSSAGPGALIMKPEATAMEALATARTRITLAIRTSTLRVAAARLPYMVNLRFSPLSR